MKIKKVAIRSFGKINGRTFEVTDGINVLYGENESGKTTFHTFLRCMLYGMARMRGKAAKNDPYTAYEPWDNPAGYGGTLWFEAGGRDYRLTRNFSRERREDALYCETTGESLSVEDGALDKLLGNVSEAVYENTVSVGQLKSVTGPELVRELQNYMAGLGNGADASIDLGRAAQMLKMSRKGYQVQASNREKEMQSLIIQTEDAMTRLEEELRDIRERYKEAREERKRLAPSEKRAGDEVVRSQIAALKRGQFQRNLIFLGLSGLIMLLGIVIHLPLVARLVCFVLALGLFGLGLFFNQRDNEEIRVKEKARENWHSRLSRATSEGRSLKEMFDEKAKTYVNLRDEYQELLEEKNLPGNENVEIEALTLALATIDRLSGNISQDLGERLRMRTSEILEDITGGKYEEVLMDENLRMSVNTQERVVPLERLSRGTLEQIYFALRMAAGEIFAEGEDFPVILDDVFGMYDEERLSGVLRWLERQKRQIIISTCNKRDIETLEKEGISFNRLDL